MFSLKDRGYSEYLILLPGWGFDEKIFAELDLPYNYLLCSGNKTNTAEDVTAMLCKHGIDTISVFGFSQGAYTACEICRILKERVTRVIFAGARPFYPEKELNEVHSGLRTDCRTYMNRFYRECFTREERIPFKWFKKNLQKNYLENISENSLSQGIDLLACSQMDRDSLLEIKRVDFLHGRDDRIAPISEITEFASAVPGSRMMVFDNTGHLPFLHDEFRDRIDEM